MHKQISIRIQPHRIPEITSHCHEMTVNVRFIYHADIDLKYIWSRGEVLSVVLLIIAWTQLLKRALHNY